jgi:riboflavin transporter FmnP
MINKIKIRKITTAAVLSALSIVMVAFLRTPLFPTAAPYLEYDPADIPLLIGAVSLGPIWGFAMTIVVAGIQAVTVSAQSGIYGFVMHIIATGALVLIYSLILKYLKLGFIIKNITAVFTATLITTAAMAAGNLLITPYFTGLPFAAVKGMIIPIIIPFNAISHGGNAIIATVLYKYLSVYINKFKEDRA